MIIKLDSVRKVKEFVNITTHYTGKVEVSSGRYTVDGKSIMGIFSLELKNNLFLKIEPVKDSSGLIQELKPYIVE